MNELLWIREFRTSVSWADQIKTCLEHHVGFPVLTIEMNNGLAHCWIESSLACALELPRKLELLSAYIKSSEVTALFTDQELAARDVEMLMHYTRGLNCGIDFLSAQASVMRNDLLLLYSEESIMEDIE